MTKCAALFALLVRRVLPTEPAVLGELEPLGRLLLVLRRAVIAPLALGARERDDVSHWCIPEGGWGLGIGDWGDWLPVTNHANPQPPIPDPRSTR